MLKFLILLVMFVALTFGDLTPIESREVEYTSESSKKIERNRNGVIMTRTSKKNQVKGLEELEYTSESKEKIEWIEDGLVLKHTSNKTEVKQSEDEKTKRVEESVYTSESSEDMKFKEDGLLLNHNSNKTEVKQLDLDEIVGLEDQDTSSPCNMTDESNWSEVARSFVCNATEQSREIKHRVTHEKTVESKLNQKTKFISWVPVNKTDESGSNQVEVLPEEVIGHDLAKTKDDEDAGKDVTPDLPARR